MKTGTMKTVAKRAKPRTKVRLAAGDPATEGRLAGLTHAMMARGASAFDASHRALAILEATIDRQANLLSYLDAFRFVGILSLICVPLILFSGRSVKISKAVAAAAAESH